MLPETPTDKASFLDAAIHGLRLRLQAFTDKFQAYFLALFSDKGYTKVLDSQAKVDKAHKRTASLYSAHVPLCSFLTG